MSLRERIERLTRYDVFRDEMRAYPDGPYVELADVLALLGEEEARCNACGAPATCTGDLGTLCDEHCLHDGAGEEACQLVGKLATLPEYGVKVLSRVRAELSGKLIVGKVYRVERHDAAGAQAVIAEDGTEAWLRRGEFEMAALGIRGDA